MVGLRPILRRATAGVRCRHSVAGKPALPDDGVKGVHLGAEETSVEFASGETFRFDNCWLRDNCPCPKCMSSSGQKNDRTIRPGSKALQVLDAGPTDDGNLRLVWHDHEGVQDAIYEGSWLRKFAYSGNMIEEEQASRRAREGREKASGLGIAEIEYETIRSGDAWVWKWMCALDASGFCLIRNTPVVHGIVKEVANLIGPCSHTIYGETFDVVATPKPINIAYSDKALEPHMDLAYFESPPAVQFLHCLKFDEGVRGGGSTLIDAHAVAEELKEQDPEAFRILSTVPATFQKDHVEREHPVRMFYQRPHIATNYLGEVTACFWAPPFEGPLRVKEECVVPYYTAYNKFRRLLMSHEMWEKYGFLFRLRPGDLLTFNNRRMLHGRNAFTSENGERHLQGCYLDVDSFLNKFNILAMNYDEDTFNEPLGNENRFGTTSHR